METRLITSADLPVLAALHRESFGAACWSVVQIEDSLALPTTQALVLCEDSVIQGFILCQRVGDEQEILTFCVAVVFRRKGAGQKLLAAAIEDARRHKVQRFFLDVSADNDAAQALYAKQGFAVTGRGARYYADGADAVLMAKDL